MGTLMFMPASLHAVSVNSSFSMSRTIKLEGYSNMRFQTLYPFQFEANGKFDDAIREHEVAITTIEEFLEMHKKEVVKFAMDMFERQRDVHLERIGYLRGKEKEGWVDMVLTPTEMSAEDEVNGLGGNSERCLSFDHKELAQFAKIKESRPTPPETIKHLLHPEFTSFYTPTLPSNTPPTVYRITHDSDSNRTGEKSHWFFIRDVTNTHTLYAMHTLCKSDIPTTHCLLRRASEFLPGAGSVQVLLQKTPGGAFKLFMSRPDGVGVVETPDRGDKSSSWSPRRFEYGGRQFVWKNNIEGGAHGGGKKKGLLAKAFGFEWEDLWEYKPGSVKVVKGSKTGKTEEEVVGERLCWGGKGDGGVGEGLGEMGREKVEFTVFVRGGVDQVFGEQMLASSLARLVRLKYSFNDPVGAGVGRTTGMGAGLFGFVVAKT